MVISDDTRTRAITFRNQFNYLSAALAINILNHAKQLIAALRVPFILIFLCRFLEIGLGLFILAFFLRFSLLFPVYAFGNFPLMLLANMYLFATYISNTRCNSFSWNSHSFAERFYFVWNSLTFPTTILVEFQPSTRYLPSYVSIYRI